MLTNEEFHLVDDRQIYSSGPVCETIFPHSDTEGSWETGHRTGYARGRRVGSVSSIPKFVEEVRAQPNILVEYLDPKLMPKRSRKVVAKGRKPLWLRWIDGNTHTEYVLKGDHTIRQADGYAIAGRLLPTTDVLSFANRLRAEGHEIVYIHPRFQKPRDVVRRRGKSTPSPTRENGATANVRPVKTV